MKQNDVILTDNIKLLQSIISSKPSRILLKHLTKKCSRDGDSRIEIALELYSEARRKACFTCTHIISPLAKIILRRGASIFGTSEEELKKQFRTPYWRKGLTSVLNGLSKFGARKPFTPGSPLLVVWNYTYRCNLKCKHCYSSSGKPLPNEMTTEEALRTVRILAEKDVASIAFSGGEPLLRKDIFKVAREATELGIYTAIATNAIIITREMAHKIKETGIKYIQISLDGATPETHDNFRGVKGTFEKTIRGIKNCIEEGLFIEIATTVTKQNYHEIPSIIELCEKMRVPWLVTYNFIPTGRGREIIKLDLTPMEREKLLEFFAKKNYEENNKVTLLSTAPQYARVTLNVSIGKEKMLMPTHFYNIPASSKTLKIAEFIGGCGAGRIYCSIEPDGTIQPCVFMPIKIGNILKDNFEYLWDNHKVFKDLRDREKLKGSCSKCKYKYICGGCRARAYAYFNDYLAPDPGCINNEQYWREIVGS